MFRYALLACLCLTLELRAELLHSREESFDKYVISSDTFGDGHSYVYATFKESQEPQKILATFTLLNDTRGQTKDCSLMLRAKDNTEYWEPQSLRRVSDSKFALSWINHASSGSTSEVIAYDMSDCREIEVPEKLNRLSEFPLVVPAKDDEFDLFVKDANACDGIVDGCWIHYDLRKMSRKIRPFSGADFHWGGSVRVERLSSDDLLVVSSAKSNGQVDESAFLLDSASGEMRQLMKTRTANFLPMVSTGLSFCWLARVGAGSSDVKCRQMRENGDEIFERTLSFDDGRWLLHARTTGEGELVLVSTTRECATGGECKAVSVTRIAKGMKNEDVKNSTWRFTGQSTSQQRIYNVEYDEEERKITFQYGSVDGSVFYFGFEDIYESN